MSKLVGEMRRISGKPVAAYEGFSWPCFWLGPFWFAFKGMWVFAIAGSVVALVSPYGYFMTQLAVPFCANALYRYHLSKRGYSRHDSVTPAASPCVPLHLRRKDKQLRGQRNPGVQVAASESPGEVAKRGAKPRGKLKSFAMRGKSGGGVAAKRETARGGTGTDKGAKTAKGKRGAAKVGNAGPLADRIDGKAGIQAIVDASRGDCVVYPGEYVGPLRIQRSVEIDFNNSTLHARKGPVLVIDAPRVRVRNVTIEVTGSSDELCVEEAVAVKVVRSGRLRFENVTLFGSLEGFADEEGVWDIPKKLDFGLLRAGMGHAFSIKVRTPVRCVVMSDCDAVVVSPPSIGAGCNELRLCIPAFMEGRLLCGNIWIKTNLARRKVALSGSISQNTEEGACGSGENDQLLWDYGVFASEGTTGGVDPEEGKSQITQATNEATFASDGANQSRPVKDDVGASRGKRLPGKAFGNWGQDGSDF